MSNVENALEEIAEKEAVVAETAQNDKKKEDSAKDIALANIVPGLSPPFNGHETIDGFDDFGRVFLTINLRANVPQH